MSEPFLFDEESVTTHDLVVEGARSGLNLQREDGSFPAGRNYSYDEPETPVRTTSHWIRTMAKAFEITDDNAFSDAANRGIDYLLTDEVRPYGHTYHCRNAESKDRCNGLVGQANVIRALGEAGTVLSRDDALEVATEIFSVHPFNEQLGLWERVEIDGTRISFDRTLNHQILFAAAASNLASVLPVANRRLQRFIDRLDTNMEIRSNGLIRHYVQPPILRVLFTVARTPRYRNLLRNEIVSHYHTFSEERVKKERGYQTVNLTALAELKEEFPMHPFWETDKLETAVKYLDDNSREIIEGHRTKHGSPIQGISVAKSLSSFQNTDIESYSNLIKGELAIDTEKGKFSVQADSVDANTQAALVVRLTDLGNIEIELDGISHE